MNLKSESDRIASKLRDVICADIDTFLRNNNRNNNN